MKGFELFRRRLQSMPVVRNLSALFVRYCPHFQPRRRSLRVEETISLGEKRFVAILQCDGERVLLGGAPNGISVLFKLDSGQAFANRFRQVNELSLGRIA
jgi:Flagellar biosynthesis protein, FliO